MIQTINDMRSYISSTMKLSPILFKSAVLEKKIRLVLTVKNKCIFSIFPWYAECRQIVRIEKKNYQYLFVVFLKDTQKYKKVQGMFQILHICITANFSNYQQY